ncbi:unnamed protein product [Symbiodinium sp. CCMP2456]|nr:unnamed protein product [Symbiodinium sp. CCMP2456]
MGRDRSRSPRRGARDDDEEDLPAEGKLMLLQVDFETLKVENQELRTRLLQALRRLDSKTPSTGRHGKEEVKKAVKKEVKKEAKPESKKEVKKEVKKEDIKKEVKKEIKKEVKKEIKKEVKQEAISFKKAFHMFQTKETPQAHFDLDSPGEEGKKVKTEEPNTNAVLLCNAQMEVYNTEVPNDVPMEERTPLVEGKLKNFMESFHEKVQILDLKTGGVLVKDKMFQKRYACVFRESGDELRGVCTKRFYFDSKSPTYCLDFETHESLVTARAGTPPDGRLGVRDPRTEHLAVLYATWQHLRKTAAFKTRLQVFTRLVHVPGQGFELRAQRASLIPVIQRPIFAIEGKQIAKQRGPHSQKLARGICSKASKPSLI